jgi:hypothetical protein
MFGAQPQAGGVNPNKDVQIQTPLADSVSSLSFSPRANLLVATLWDNNVYCWDIQVRAGAGLAGTLKVLLGCDCRKHRTASARVRGRVLITRPPSAPTTNACRTAEWHREPQGVHQPRAAAVVQRVEWRWHGRVHGGLRQDGQALEPGNEPEPAGWGKTAYHLGCGSARDSWTGGASSTAMAATAASFSSSPTPRKRIASRPTPVLRLRPTTPPCATAPLYRSSACW